MKKTLFFSLLALFTALIVCVNPLQEKPVVAQETFSILTAGKSGFYYQAASELKESLKGTGFTLDIEESAGSLQNLKELGAGKADMAFAQKDALALMLNSEPNLVKLADNVKIFAPINNEVVHIIVNSSSGINSFADLVGKRVAVGPEDSGTYISAILLYDINGFELTREDLATIEVKEAIEQVRNGQLDAAFYTADVGAPLLKDLSAQKGSILKLLPVDSQFFSKQERYFQENQQLFKDKTWSYSPIKIPANTYPWQKQEVNTISTASFLYVKKSLGTQKVYDVAKAVYAKTLELKARSSFWKLFSVTEAKKQVSAGFDYHPGVKKFLQ